MAKLRINNVRKSPALDILPGVDPLKPSKYQLEIPGIGRLRTSRKHRDFHIVLTKKPEPEEQVEVVKPKMELANKR